jgi:hypothetical protein
MFQSIFNIADEVGFNIQNTLISIAAAVVLGLIIGLVYIKTNKNKIVLQSFPVTLVLLPAIVTVIILLIGNSVARAFSLAGAFQIIRFRSVAGDPKDITYVLLTMAVGLACGMGYIVYALIFTVILCLLIAILELCSFGKSKAAEKILKIVIPEDLDYQNVFDNVLAKYTQRFTLTKVKTIDLGSLYQLTYTITAKESISEKELIDEIRTRNGNLNITLVLKGEERKL